MLGKSCPLGVSLAFFNSVVLVMRIPFPFGVWGRVWNSIVSDPNHCLFIYFVVRFIAFSMFPLYHSGQKLCNHTANIIPCKFKFFKEKSEMASFKSNENIHKKEGGLYYVVLANKASSVTL